MNKSLIAALLLAGCTTTQVLAPILLPAATCTLINKEPSAAPYLRTVADAVSKFSSQKDLSPTSLRDTLSSIPIAGLKPYEVAALYGVVIVVYTPVYEKYLKDPTKDQQIRDVLGSIATGIQSGLSQCVPVQPVMPTMPAFTLSPAKVSPTGVEGLAKSIAAEIDSKAR